MNFASDFVKKRYKMCKGLFVLLIICGFITPSFSTEELQIQWVRQYTNADSFTHNCFMTIDPFDNIYIAVSSNTDSTSSDIELLKYNSAGDLKWLKKFVKNNADFEYAQSIDTDQNGNIYILGSDNFTKNSDLLILKYDNSGNLLWDRKFDSSDNSDNPIKVILDNNGDIYVSGRNDRDYILIKYDESGHELWTEISEPDTISRNFLYDITIDDNDNIYLAGTSSSGGKGNLLVVKYNSEGNIIWKQIVNSGEHHSFTPRAIKLNTSNSKVYISGSGQSDITENDYFTIGMESDSGSALFTKIYNDSLNYPDQAQSLCIDKEGNVYVSGTSYSQNASRDLTIVKYDSLGNELWVRQFQEQAPLLESNGAMILDDKVLYITGNSGESLMADFLTAAYDTQGNLIGYNFYDAGISDKNRREHSMALDSKGNLYMTGTSQYDNGRLVMTLIKYGGIATNIKSNHASPKLINLYQNYPNPFNNHTTIAYDIPYFSQVELTVYNILGQKISTLINQKLRPGNYRMTYNAGALPSGIYYYRLKTIPISNTNNPMIETKKFILLK